MPRIYTLQFVIQVADPTEAGQDEHKRLRDRLKDGQEIMKFIDAKYPYLNPLTFTWRREPGDDD